MTTLTTRSAPHADSTTPAEGRGWVLAGIGAAVAGIAGIVGSSMAGAVYDSSIQGDAPAIVDRLAEQTPQILLFHTGATVAAVLLVWFAAGLRRWLADATGERSLLPGIASTGLLLVSVALLMGTALTTEFVFGVQDPELLVPETAAVFGHWLGTVPWVWAGAGIAALAVGCAGRRHGAVPGWLAWTSLVLGGLTILLAVSPLQYMAGMTGPLWLTVCAVALLRRR